MPLDALVKRYQQYKHMGLALDMTRGKPCSDQLALSDGMLDVVTSADFRAADGTDCRNYGGFDGIPEARALFAEFMQVAPAELLVGGNSSLTLMHDTVARCYLHSNVDSDVAWRDLPEVKFLCPVPGYDRHFAICENFGITMIPVAMTPDGPDMEQVEALVAADPLVKGMWMVPKYQNPTGYTVSDAVVKRLAAMPTAAPDFRIFWDNAYAHHHLSDTPDPLADVLAECKAAGHPNRVFLFGSTSKVSFAGSGISFFAASGPNVAWMRFHGSRQSIGPDKLNQLRHVRFFKDMDGIRAHMARHAAIIKPKFDAVLRILGEELGDGSAYGASWTVPNGGYFISFDTKDGCAAHVVALASEAGVKLTEAGATFPYGEDPRDRNIRIAPTLPALAEIEQATRIFATCVKIAALEDA
ncbi:MAG: aminotransferase [Deltaproteobacteria bacterium HGW-Deltaproteobacteria-14]|jgi:DNA-binding transcriptional MocR family regulator|nr:MAG: aminotransferase [Deltaproteobacteria bacterium HGW-Deltaproteobacteria-14]